MVVVGGCRDFDTDRSGAIDLHEFIAALRVVGLTGVQPKVAKKVMKTVDRSGEGLLQCVPNPLVLFCSLLFN